MFLRISHHYQYYYRSFVAKYSILTAINQVAVPQTAEMRSIRRWLLTLLIAHPSSLNQPPTVVGRFLTNIPPHGQLLTVPNGTVMYFSH
jgi:hypothetical protein